LIKLLPTPPKNQGANEANVTVAGKAKPQSCRTFPVTLGIGG